MAASNGARNVNREASGVTEAQPTGPTYLPPKRSDGRPSTPEGVGRVAPLTACRRGAKSSARSAGEERDRTVPGVDQAVDKAVDCVSTPVLALGVCWTRFRAADHASSRFKNRIIRESTWSAARKRMVSGSGDGGGHGVCWFPELESDRGRCGCGVGSGGRCGARREGTKAGRWPSSWYADGGSQVRRWDR
jgi:hypothetical protein